MTPTTKVTIRACCTLHCSYKSCEEGVVGVVALRNGSVDWVVELVSGSKMQSALSTTLPIIKLTTANTPVFVN